MSVRKQISKTPLSFPPYAMTLEASKERILVAGGGGDSKTGVPNRIVAIKCKSGILCEEKEYDTLKQAVMGVSISTDGMIIASVDDKCKIYSEADGGQLECVSEQVSEIKGRKDDRQVKKAKTAGKHVYSAGTDGVIRVWLSPSLDLLKEIPALPKETADFDISTATRSGAPALLIASREECRVYRHDVWMAQPDLLATLPCSAPFKFRNCRFSPDTRFIYTAEFMPQRGSLLQKWDTSSMSVVASTKIKFNRDHHTTMGLSSDGLFLALGSAEGELRVVRTSDLRIIHSSKPHSFFVSDVLFYPPSMKSEGSQHLYIISCAGDNTVACTTVDPSPPAGLLRMLSRGILFLCATLIFWNLFSPYFGDYLVWMSSYIAPYVDVGLETVMPLWERHVWPFVHPFLESFIYFAEPHIISASIIVQPYLELLSMDPRLMWLQATWQQLSIEPIIAFVHQNLDILRTFATEAFLEISRLVTFLSTWIAINSTSALHIVRPMLLRLLDVVSYALLYCIEELGVYYALLREAVAPSLDFLHEISSDLVERLAIGIEPFVEEYGVRARTVAVTTGHLIASSAEWLLASLSR
eukprot:TRINITY_DN631_c0_g1_i1.p1 TRINITY_DN631_c0_g1~~TRINITY_DN631_c0_g1_i1.p1  ORF type:complete len:583 (-),score=66.51 TRINITY_DN631_c0_g1_i1:1572-3320(-)